MLRKRNSLARLDTKSRNISMLKHAAHARYRALRRDHLSTKRPLFCYSTGRISRLFASDRISSSRRIRAKANRADEYKVVQKRESR